jgi:CHRD domain/Caspase domain
MAAQDDPLQHGYALIIGTWAYSDQRWPRLDDISLQIQQLKIAFTPHFDEVQLLPNPTFEQLDVGLRQFLRTRGNQDNARLFIYYAGHGYTETNLSRNEFRGYITGSDTPYVDDSPRSFAAARVKALSMEAVRGMVSDVNARQVLFIFDSCFAGTVFTARSPSNAPGQLSENDITRLVNLPVREFITAGDIRESIPAHSPIPQLLVNALGGAADPYGLGVATGQQIGQYLWSQTRGLGISPREGKLPGGYFDQGEFVFRVGLSRLPIQLRPVGLPGAPVHLPPVASIPSAPVRVVFRAKLSSAEEVPPVTPTGFGEANASLDTVTHKLTYDLTFSGLSEVTAAHLHGPAPAGLNAGVVVPLGDTRPTSPIHGTATLTSEQEQQLTSGRWYVNVHTRDSPAGAIRGQMTRRPARSVEQPR